MMQFSRIYSICILFVGALVVLAQPPTDLPRQYLMRKDYFQLLKSGEFSIMDPTEKELYYRIESRYSFVQRLEIFRYPEKIKTGNLTSRIHPLTYRGNIFIFNATRNQWVDGKIEQYLQWFHTLYSIRWNGHSINMTNTAVELTHRFRDESGELLADFRLQLSSVFWRKKYDVKIYTNKYPEEIYLLTLAAFDRVTSSGKKG